MKAFDKLAEELKKTAKEKGQELSDGEAKEGARNLVGFFDLLWKGAQEESRKQKLLKTEPQGFPVDGSYSCLLCGRSINETNGWYDWFGQTCLLCHKAVKDGIIPTFVFKNRNSYFAMWALDSKFKIKHQTAKKYIREGKLIARIVLREDGKPHEYIFLKKENQGLIERYSPERKSYDRSHNKRMDARIRAEKVKLLAEYKEEQKRLRKKYPNLYKK